MLNKEEEQVKKNEPIKPKSNSKQRQVWQMKVIPPLETPLEASPQESSSSRANRAPPHPASSLSNHDNNQLGGEGIPRVSREVFLYLLLVLVCFIYIRKKDE